MDGVTSQRPLDRTIALDRMKDAGAVLTTSESLILMIMQDSSDVKFKSISNLLKETNKTHPRGL